MADKMTQQILDALRRAAVEPTGVSLHAGKGDTGLFPTNVAGKLAAQRCLDDGYLRLLRTEPRGKVAQEVYTVSDKGLAYLLEQGNPRPLLEDLVRTLEARETQLAELLTLVRNWATGMADLRGVAEKLLPAVTASVNGHVPAPTRSVQETILHCLQEWHAAGAAEDCPLPELYRRVREQTSLTVGRFHDALRELKEQERLYLHPWTGPLYALPEPTCALLSGHEVAYYASVREAV